MKMEPDSPLQPIGFSPEISNFNVKSWNTSSFVQQMSLYSPHLQSPELGSTVDKLSADSFIAELLHKNKFRFLGNQIVERCLLWALRRSHFKMTRLNKYKSYLS